jgi:hypothetical protein
MKLYIILLVIIICVYFLNHYNDQLTQFGSGNTTPYTDTSPYLRQQLELQDIDKVLQRPVKVSKKENIKPENTWRYEDGTVRSFMELVKPLKRFLAFTDIEKDKVTSEDKEIVKQRQHEFLGDANIVDRYGKKFYWDKRFPRKLIPIEFARDPEKFVEEHPNVYPSYVIASQNSQFTI